VSDGFRDLVGGDVFHFLNGSVGAGDFEDAGVGAGG